MPQTWAFCIAAKGGTWSRYSPEGGRPQIFKGAGRPALFETLADAGMQKMHACGPPGTCSRLTL